MNRLMRTLLAFALPLAACSPSPRQPPLAGARIGGPFALIDQNGGTVTERNFAGKYRIMYFGYTFCPDVCPTDVQKIAAGLKLFAAAHPAEAAKVVPIFVTVDPARDTPAVLKQWLAAFDPRFVGLTGSAQAIASAAKEYAVSYERGETSPGGGYLMNHTSAAYLFGPDGKPIAVLPADAEGSPQQVADALAEWVR